ncbi:MAG: DUF885 domain-containing protein [Candidatus Aminicenantes bacterium]|nr:DUF885 domain-containing protein [Candidatus Aminicenantes bacterium]
MRKIFIPLAIFLIVFSSTGPLMSSKDGEDSKFQKTLEKYLNEHWKFYPTAATLAGFHDYDSKLEDFSEKNLEKRIDVLDTYNKEFAAEIDRNKLSTEVLIDYEMMLDALGLEILKNENLLPWEYDPIFYNEIFINCIQSLFAKEFAPLETRAKNAVERLKDLPKFIKQAKENLKTPPLLYTETAIQQFPAILDFYKTRLPELIAAAPADSKSKLQDGLNKVLPALVDYQNFLKNQLLPRSTGNFRVGQQVHTRLLRLTLQNDIPIQELINRATPDSNNIRRDMFFTSVPFYNIMDPKIDLQNPPPGLTKDQLYNEVISHVMERITGEHVSKDEYIEKIKDSAGEIKDFISNNQLLALPDEDLDIQPMPLCSQGITMTRVVTPGVYESQGSPTVLVSPISDDWDEEQTNLFLQEYNNSYLYFWTIRKIYPGEFVPLVFTGKHPSFVRKLYPNRALIKSWPIFTEEMLVMSGFGNYDLRLRLNQLKNLLKTVLDFQLDLNVHQGGMTKDQAIRWMTITGFQTQAEAERKWNSVILKPGDATLAYVGFQELQDMEKQYKGLKGDSFTKKEFLERLLSYGALPLRHLKRKMVE